MISSPPPPLHALMAAGDLVVVVEDHGDLDVYPFCLSEGALPEFLCWLASAGLCFSPRVVFFPRSFVLRARATLGYLEKEMSPGKV